MELPRILIDRLPEDLPAEAVTACLSLTGGLGEAHVVAGEGRLVGFVKASALGGLTRVDLDPRDPPRVETVQWQPVLTLRGLDGAVHHAPLPTMGQDRVRAQIAELYRALGADDALRALYAGALAEARRADEVNALRFELAQVCERVAPAEAVAQYAALLDALPRHEGARAGLERLQAAGVALDRAEARLLALYRQVGDFAAAVALLRAQTARLTEPSARFAHLVEIATLCERRL
ncbi:MAG: hypothetical protein KC620_03575, partial [Myxococcales bacterium]|nr:hypothetical protein [Myxococcales bacterium]